MSLVLKAIFIAALALAAHFAEADETRLIQLKSVAEIDGSQSTITLADLIVARGLSEEAMKVIADVTVADSPRPGESRSFSAGALEQLIKPYLNDIEIKAGAKIALRIPARVSVSRKSFRLTPDEIERELLSQFKGMCAECTYEISNLTLPMLPTNIDSASSWKIRLRPELPKGSFSLPLEVSNPDASKRTYWISGQLAIRKSVLVLSRAIQAGEKINAEDFTTQTKDITFATDAPALNPDVTTSVAARVLSAGEVIWRSQLRRELAVKNGDAVKVTAGSENWQISIDGVAQTNGYIGDLVRVKIPRTQKIVSGLLKDKGQVEVQ